MTMQSYAALLDISRQMLELAKLQEWESLSLAQEKRAALVASLNARQAAMTVTEMNAVAPAIREIQQLDREILQQVNPWREDVAKLLARLSPAV